MAAQYFHMKLATVVQLDSAQMQYSFCSYILKNQVINGYYSLCTFPWNQNILKNQVINGYYSLCTYPWNQNPILC